MRRISLTPSGFIRGILEAALRLQPRRRTRMCRQRWLAAPCSGPDAISLETQDCRPGWRASPECWKKADQPTQLFRIPVGNRRSHGHIVFTGVPAQQGLKSAEKRHEQRDLCLPAKSCELGPRAAGNRNATLPPLWLRTDRRAPTQHIDQRDPVTTPIPAPQNFRTPIQYPRPIAR
jgi:hypothetical protein